MTCKQNADGKDGTGHEDIGREPSRTSETDLLRLATEEIVFVLIWFPKQIVSCDLVI